MNKGDIHLHYNWELDELFLIKRGVIFGKYILETEEGSSLFTTLKELEQSTSLIIQSTFIDEF